MELIPLVTCCLCGCTTRSPNPYMANALLASHPVVPWGSGTAVRPKKKICHPCKTTFQVVSPIQILDPLIMLVSLIRGQFLLGEWWCSFAYSSYVSSRGMICHLTANIADPRIAVDTVLSCTVASYATCFVYVHSC